MTSVVSLFPATECMEKELSAEGSRKPPLPPEGGEKPERSSVLNRTISPSSRNETKHSLELTERSWNVYENKRSLGKSKAETGVSKRGSQKSRKVLWLKLDNKSTQPERGKACFKN